MKSLRRNIYCFFTIVSSLNSALAGKDFIEINIKNNSCVFPTKFKGTALYKDNEEEEFSAVIPPLNVEQNQIPIISIKIKRERLNKLYLSLSKNNDTGEEEQIDEVIAMNIFTPSFERPEFLQIELKGSAILIEEKVSLPPKFTED